MLKKRKLVEDTLITIDRLKIEVDEGFLRMLEQSLSQDSDSRESDLDYCELPVSSEEIDRLVDTLFDAETEYAPRGLGIGSEEEERRGREAGNIAKLINGWNSK